MYAPISLLLLALLAGRSDATHDLEGVTSAVESSAVLFLPGGVLSFVSDSGSFSVRQRS